mgnify:CR=1 FL=1
MVRLHALDGIHVESLALEVNGALLGQNGAFTGAARPEGVAHPSPGVFGVGSVRGSTSLASLVARGSLGDLEVDNGLLVVHALDGPGVSILGEFESAVVSEEVDLVLGDFEVGQRRRRPQVRLGGVLGEDLASELTRRSNAPVYVVSYISIQRLGRESIRTQRHCK